MSSDQRGAILSLYPTGHFVLLCFFWILFPAEMRTPKDPIYSIRTHMDTHGHTRDKEVYTIYGYKHTGRIPMGREGVTLSPYSARGQLMTCAFFFPFNLGFIERYYTFLIPPTLPFLSIPGFGDAERSSSPILLRRIITSLFFFKEIRSWGFGSAGRKSRDGRFWVPVVLCPISCGVLESYSRRTVY